MSGTTRAGLENEQQTARWVRNMFSGIAPRYDLLNHLLSFNIDRTWRKRTVARLARALAEPQARVLDVCCGTGDLTLALRRASAGPASVIGSDFCRPMLLAARKKGQGAWFEADALHLPVADRSLHVVTAAFGFRNLVNYEAGLLELRRVLRPGGTAAILEFSQPPNLILAGLYSFYSTELLPRIGGLLSGSPDAYAYLPESVRKFPGAEELAARMSAAGFREVKFERMTFGVVAIHTGVA